ncbi:hypothetical protein F5J12DRAFT_782735 [Pisolithus orientalis]|uniref:uncharacterized protein n=1 Tax=Pisolithus orientalis TaxID=936130 RepID=UPI002225744C|nr:uncharacterized protein F5J12DRAFT_782735 [Pisolithus orientalis]KAI6007744.1 hypothetical protein F5J12DRAFT_782735 [Pisolithus orientalis]
MGSLAICPLVAFQCVFLTGLLCNLAIGGMSVSQALLTELLYNLSIGGMSGSYLSQVFLTELLCNLHIGGMSVSQALLTVLLCNLSIMACQAVVSDLMAYLAASLLTGLLCNPSICGMLGSQCLLLNGLLCHLSIGGISGSWSLLIELFTLVEYQLVSDLMACLAGSLLTWLLCNLSIGGMSGSQAFLTGFLCNLSFGGMSGSQALLTGILCNLSTGGMLGSQALLNGLISHLSIGGTTGLCGCSNGTFSSHTADSAPLRFVHWWHVSVSSSADWVPLQFVHWWHVRLLLPTCHVGCMTDFIYTWLYDRLVVLLNAHTSIFHAGGMTGETGCLLKGLTCTLHNGGIAVLWPGGDLLTGLTCTLHGGAIAAVECLLIWLAFALYMFMASQGLDPCSLGSFSLYIGHMPGCSTGFLLNVLTCILYAGGLAVYVFSPLLFGMLVACQKVNDFIIKTCFPVGVGGMIASGTLLSITFISQISFLITPISILVALCQSDFCKCYVCDLHHLIAITLGALM